LGLRSSYIVLSSADAGLGQTLSYWTVPVLGALSSVSTEGAVPQKPSESGNNNHFQRHRCPGPDFKAEKAKNALFSLKTPPEEGIFCFFKLFRIITGTFATFQDGHTGGTCFIAVTGWALDDTFVESLKLYWCSKPLPGIPPATRWNWEPILPTAQEKQPYVADQYFHFKSQNLSKRLEKTWPPQILILVKLDQGGPRKLTCNTLYHKNKKKSNKNNFLVDIFLMDNYKREIFIQKNSVG
jgi:hypothetical protein